MLMPSLPRYPLNDSCLFCTNSYKFTQYILRASIAHILHTETISAWLWSWGKDAQFVFAFYFGWIAKCREILGASCMWLSGKASFHAHAKTNCTSLPRSLPVTQIYLNAVMYLILLVWSSECITQRDTQHTQSIVYLGLIPFPRCRL